MFDSTFAAVILLSGASSPPHGLPGEIDGMHYSILSLFFNVAHFTCGDLPAMRVTWEGGLIKYQL